MLVDGQSVGTFTPGGTSYAAYTTATFTVTAGTHTITFQGLDDAGGDNTAFIDAVAITVISPTLPTVGDAGFESPSIGSGNFAYQPAGTAWTFAGSSGISGNASAFTSGNPSAPEGTQVAILQETGSISQAVAGWVAGTYQINFDAAQRGAGNSDQDFQVMVDGVSVGTFTPSGTSYNSYSTATFTVTAGTHTIVFQGLDDAGGDNTAFLDAVTVGAN